MSPTENPYFALGQLELSKLPKLVLFAKRHNNKEKEQARNLFVHAFKIKSLPSSDSWRCLVHLFKHLYTNTDMMGLSNHHTAEKGNGFCSREERVLVQNVQINHRTKAKDAAGVDKTESLS